MPELPEVEITRRGLLPLIKEQKITGVSFDWPKSFPNKKQTITKAMIGAKIINVKRRGKTLIIELSTKYSLVVHLKMTGQLVLRGAKSFGAGHPTKSLIGDLPDKSTRVKVSFKSGDMLFFNDQRKFGWMKLVKNDEISQMPFFAKLGPEPLEPSTTSKIFVQRIRRRNGSKIKPAILNQEVIVGVGNIYADEALFIAKVHPETRVKKLSDDKLAKLFCAVQKVLKTNLESGAIITDKNYSSTVKNPQSRITFAGVYPGVNPGVYPACKNCGDEIAKIKVGGRGTYYCPNCQKNP